MSEPIHIISLGAGVQSSTMALMAAKGEITPMPQCAIFADTQDEPKSVYLWLEWLKPRLNFPVSTVSFGKLSEHSLAMHRTKDGRLFSKTNIPVFTRNHDGSIGKIRMRGCTSDFKIYPILRLIRQLLGKPALLGWRRNHKLAIRAWNKAKKEKSPCPHWAWKEMQSDPLAVQWIGISTDEATRMKQSRDPWSVTRWPLIEAGMSRRKCIKWMADNGFPKPPRSACVYCPFHDDIEWLRLKTDEPDAFAQAVIFEGNLQRAKSASQNFKTTPFLHKSCQPLNEVDFAKRDTGQINLFENECEGMCGV